MGLSISWRRGKLWFLQSTVRNDMNKIATLFTPRESYIPKGGPVPNGNVEDIAVNSVGKVVLVTSEGRRKLTPYERFNYGYVKAKGDTIWFNEKGVPHKSNGPAIVYKDGSEEWYVDGEIHRSSGPARVHANKVSEWWFHNKLHRTDGPARVYHDGSEQWWVEGERHRVDGPAVVRAKRELKGFLKRSAFAGFEEYWYCDGVLSSHPDLCEKAIRSDLTEDEFYELCMHPDYVVRQVAAANQRCPEEWKTLAMLKGE